MEEAFDLSEEIAEFVRIGMKLCIRFVAKGWRQNLLLKTSNLQPLTFS